MIGLGRNGTIQKSKAKFKVGDRVMDWVANRMLGKVIEQYYMDWTLSNPDGGWYYNTEEALGQSEIILKKESKE